MSEKIETVEELDAARSVVAEYKFSHYEFPFLVKDVGDWETKGPAWWRSVFLELPGQQESTKVVFRIVFKMGNAGLVEVKATFAEDQPIGHS